MVRGIEKFKEYFKDFPDSYVIIGGTACDITIEQAGLKPRATNDIDIILIVEVLNKDFVAQFWEFIKSGNYEKCEKSEEARQYYRFRKPEISDYPLQIEIFSRIPDILDLADTSRYTPIPVDDDLSSLSAILMNDDYYFYSIANSTNDNGIHIAGIEALICLKAKAYLDLKEDKEKGKPIDNKKILKHKYDVFRLALLLSADNVFEISVSIKTDLKTFMNTISDDLPDIAIFKEMGAGNINVQALFEQLKNNFKLND